MSKSKLHTDAFKAGYSDAYYGKDKSDQYKGQDLQDYLAGIEDFFEDYYDTLDVVREINGD